MKTTVCFITLLLLGNVGFANKNFITRDSIAKDSTKKLSFYTQLGGGMSYLIAPKFTIGNEQYEITDRSTIGEFVSGAIGMQLKNKWNFSIREKIMTANNVRNYVFFDNGNEFKDQLSFRSYNLLSLFRIGRQFSIGKHQVEIGAGIVWNYDFNKVAEFPIFQQYVEKPYGLSRVKIEQYNYSSARARPHVYLTYLKKLKKNSIEFNLSYEQMFIYYDTNFYTDNLYSFSFSSFWGSLYHVFNFSIYYRL